ncbi:MAG: GlsB/YeaQ/YmgE family stress response membrane protein [Acidobacteriaceae bacterium]
MHGILWWIIVGLIAGWLTGKVMKGSGFGVIGDIIIGILGALAGGFIFSHLGFGPGGMIYSIIVAFIGAVILTWLFRLITGNRA